MTPSQIAALRRLTDAATSWNCDSNQTPFYNDADGHSRGGDNDGTWCIVGEPFSIDGEEYDPPILTERCSEADAKFIAEAKPAILAILALLDHLDAMSARVEAMQKTLTIECRMCSDSGIVGSPPDNYFDCPDCVARRSADQDAARYRWLLDNYARGDGYNNIDAALNDGEPEKYLSPAIDAAIATQGATNG